MKKTKLTQGQIEKEKDHSLLETITGPSPDKAISLFYHKITPDFKIKVDHKVEASKRYQSEATFFQVQSYQEAKTSNSNPTLDLATKSFKLSNLQI